MKTASATFFFLLISFLSTASSQMERIDSCRRALSIQTGKEKLDTYRALYKIAYDADMDLQLDIIRGYDAEATRQEDVEAMGDAKYRRMTVLHNFNEIDRLVEETDGVMEECRKVGSMDYYYRLAGMKAEDLVLQSKPQTALRFIIPVFEEARRTGNLLGLAECANCYGTLYIATGDNAQATKYMLEALEYCQKLGDEAVNTQMDIYFKLCNVYFTDHKYKEAFNLTTTYLTDIDRAVQRKDAAVNVDGRYALCYFLRGTAAYNLKDKEETVECLEKILAHTDNGKRMEVQVETLRMYAAAIQGEYGAAIATADELIEAHREAGLDLCQCVYLLDKADFLQATSRPMEEAALLRNYIKLTEKVRADETLQQQNEFSALYELEKKENARRLLTNWLWASVAICLLLVALTAVVVRYNRALRYRNFALCRQMEEVSVARRQMEELRRKALEKEKEEADSSFSEQLDNLMRTERLFADAEMNRDKLAARMGTNRTYLSAYLRDVYGQTFPEYITSLRLADALRLLEDNTSQDMQQLAVAVGYTSYTSFYRAFMKQYGVKPGDYVEFLRGKTVQINLQEGD